MFILCRVLIICHFSLLLLSIIAELKTLNLSVGCGCCFVKLDQLCRYNSIKNLETKMQRHENNARHAKSCGVYIFPKAG